VLLKNGGKEAVDQIYTLNLKHFATVSSREFQSGTPAKHPSRREECPAAFLL